LSREGLIECLKSALELPGEPLAEAG
jgi:hypothetical protein